MVMHTDMRYQVVRHRRLRSVPPIDNLYMATTDEVAGLTGIGESALLGVYRSTNVTIKGLTFLGVISTQRQPAEGHRHLLRLRRGFKREVALGLCQWQFRWLPYQWLLVRR